MKTKGQHDTETLIRLEAYLLSERAGHPPGMDAIFWKQAEALVREGKSLSKKPDGKPAEKQKAVSKKAPAKVAAEPVAAEKSPSSKPTVTKTARKPKTKGAADHNRLDA